MPTDVIPSGAHLRTSRMILDRIYSIQSIVCVTLITLYFERPWVVDETVTAVSFTSSTTVG